MKQSGVVIYTVILGSLDSTTKTLWQNCASKPENYFNSPDKTVLGTAFQQIGSQLARLIYRGSVLRAFAGRQGFPVRRFAVQKFGCYG